MIIKSLTTCTFQKNKLGQAMFYSVGFKNGVKSTEIKNVEPAILLIIKYLLFSGIK